MVDEEKKPADRELFLRTDTTLFVSIGARFATPICDA
jgi:hypothetical protein